MPRRFTRRALASTALAAGAGLAQTNTPPTYGGALEGFESKVDLTEFDPLVYTRGRHDQAPLRLTFKATNRKDAEAWQKMLHAKLVELLGGFPPRTSTPRTQILERREFKGYFRERFVLESHPGVMVLGYLLIPKTAGPHPLMVCIPGHGRGVDDIVGIDDRGKDRTVRERYQFDFAVQAVEHGMAAVAIEPMAFGCRRDAATRAVGLKAYACPQVAGAALLLGETLLSWRIFDVMRTIDWASTRPEFDPQRIGCMGISFGGTCTLWSAAMDPRIRVAYVSGYLNTFRDAFMVKPHCIDNYVPGILNWAELYDVAGLIAPRALFVETGDKDNINPVAGVLESYKRVQKVYDVFGAAGEIAREVFSGPHQFHGVLGLPFAARKLGVPARKALGRKA